MSNIACPTLEALSAFLLGNLPEPELTEVAEHLSECTECENQVSRLESTSDEIVECLPRILDHRLDAGDVLTGLTGERAANAPEPATESWGEFRIVREIGRGGMGVVCEAFQGSLNRHVALKFLPEHGDLARFRREARAAGRLHHTNIVPVFGVGEQNRRHFYVMQYIAGRGLDVVLKERNVGAGVEKRGLEPARVPSGVVARLFAPLRIAHLFAPLRRGGEGGWSARGGTGDRTAGCAVGFDGRETARIGLQAAEALAYAHAQGVIHRDIKPSNLLLDEQGTVWVTDFGLAQDQSDTVTLTHTGDFVGTLRYAAPERITGQGDARADIYGLGVTLYELVCGRPAYAAEDRAMLLHQVLHDDPPPPRTICPRIARDLETIVLKAMERGSDARYQTADALAEDLRRFLADRTILARRVSLWERTVRWSRRNKAVASLLAALVLVFLAGFAGVTVQWRRADGESIRANAEAVRANRLAQAEKEARAAESKLRIEAQAEVASRDFDRALDLAQKGDVDYGLLWMAQALAEAPPERAEFARMARRNLAAWESQVPRRAVLNHGAELTSASFRPDGRVIMTTGRATARLWDTASGRSLSPPLVHPDLGVRSEFSPDGRLVATLCNDGGVRIWNTGTGQLAGPILVHRAGHVDGEWRDGLAFSRDGRLLLSYGLAAGAKLWDVATRRRIDLPKEADTSGLAHFSPDGNRLLLVHGDFKTMRICDLSTRSLDRPTIQGDDLGWARFSPDGRLVGPGEADGVWRLWDAATGQAVASLPGVTQKVVGTAFSHDGRLVVLSSLDGMAGIWDVAKGRLRGVPLRHRDSVRIASFSPDGRLILTSSSDGTAQLWDVATNRPLGAPLRHRGAVREASFSSDGRLVLTPCEDGTAQVWEIGRGDLTAIPATAARPADAQPSTQRRTPNRNATFNLDGSRAVLASGRTARLIETDTGQPIGRPMIHRWAKDMAVVLSPDGRLVATSGHDVGWADGGSTWTTCRVWDADTCRPTSPLLPHTNYVSALAFSPDSRMLATGDFSGAVHLWNAQTGAMIGRPFAAGAIVITVAFSPDGRLLAAGTAGPTVYQAALWDLGSGRARGEPVRFHDWARLLAFSPDSADLAVAAHDGLVQIIETATGRVKAVLRHDGPLRGVAFTPDGRFILTNNSYVAGGSARLWDARTGEPVSQVMSYPRQTWIPAALSPDGAAFAIGREDGAVSLWDVATARPIGVSAALRDECQALTFRRDGRTLLAVDYHGNVRAWPVPRPVDGTVEGLIRRVQVRTDMEIDQGKEVTILAPKDSERLRAEDGDAPLLPEATDEQAWHETNARDAEALGDSFGARWHLDRLIAERPDDGLLHARRARALLWAGDLALAQAEIERAIALGPRDRILDWMLHRALDFQEEGHPADALRLFDRVIAARPADWLTYALRTEVFAAVGRTAEAEADVDRAISRDADISFLIRVAAERSRAGQWAQAVPLYDRAIARGTVPYEVWMQAATAHLEVADEDGFRRVCQILRERYPANVYEGNVRAMLASVLILGAGGVGDDRKALGWIEPLAAAMPLDQPIKRELLRILGAVLYRLGRYRDALDRSRQGIALGDGRLSIDDAIFLAMAHYQTGDADKARALLSRPWSDAPDSPSAEAWWADRGRRLLRREAERIIFDRDMPANPFAP
jgi:WD40 repeat protein/serine/threonine protein kinase/tetratricopeptide (TPR) repeat protein